MLDKKKRAQEREMESNRKSEKLSWVEIVQAVRIVLFSFVFFFNAIFNGTDKPSARKTK